jgi:hypothetical protein
MLLSWKLEVKRKIVVPDSEIKANSSLLCILRQKHYLCAAMSAGRIYRPPLNQSEGTAILIKIAGQQKFPTDLIDVIMVKTRIHCSNKSTN